MVNFRNSNGVHLTKALFYEKASVKTNVLYTLKDKDITIDSKAVFPSLYRLYMEMEDITEFNFAETYFENWEHWQLLCSLSWFSFRAERFRHDLELKLKSQALAHIIAVSRSSNRDAYGASKYILEKGYEKKRASSVGRPSREQIHKEAKILVTENSLIDQDYARILNKRGD